MEAVDLAPDDAEPMGHKPPCNRNGLDPDLGMICIPTFIATTTGNAEFIAEEICDELSKRVRIECRLMDTCSADDVVGIDFALIISSTYGTGEIPDNGQALYNELEAKSPKLDELRYGVISLGDSTYTQTFAFGGKHWDRLLQSLGARRVGDMLVLDASSDNDMEEVALNWVYTWLDRLSS